MDMGEFERLCQGHRRAVLAYAFTCCRTLDVAEDIVQETLTIAFQKRDQYFPEADFGGWLISIARRVWFRERDRRRLSANAARYLDDNAPLLFDPERFGDKRWEEEKKVLTQCLEKLSEVDRSIIQAHFAENRKYAAIAQAMQRTVNWVKTRMFRARSSLLECVRLAMGENQVMQNES